jgi:hypothetical protein
MKVLPSKTLKIGLSLPATSPVCRRISMRRPTGGLFQNERHLSTPPIEGHCPRWSNVANNLSGVSLMLRAMLGLKKTTLHRLFSLHIKARGSSVPTVAEAEHVFSVNTGTTPFDLDRIAAEYL